MKSLMVICCMGFLCLTGFSAQAISESIRWKDAQGVALAVMLAILALAGVITCGATARAIGRDQRIAARRNKWKRFPTPDDNDF